MNIIEEFRLFVVIEEFTGILLKYMYIVMLHIPLTS